MKTVLIYPDFLSTKQKERIRYEWYNNHLVILEGGPELHLVNEEFEEIIIEDYNSGQ